MKFALTPEDIQALNLDQKTAVLEALCCAVLADGKVDAGEIAAFDAEVGAIPWGMDRAAVTALVGEAQKRVRTLRERQQVLDFIGALAARLPSASVREKVFRSMGSVMYSDRQLSDAEKNVLVAFATVFGLTAEQINAIRADVKGE